MTDPILEDPNLQIGAGGTYNPGNRPPPRTTTSEPEIAGEPVETYGPQGWGWYLVDPFTNEIMSDKLPNPPTTGGSSTAPRTDFSNPTQDANGNWGYWRNDGSGPRWVPLDEGPATAEPGPNTTWIENQDGTLSEWNTDTGEYTGKTIGNPIPQSGTQWEAPVEIERNGQRGQLYTSKDGRSQKFVPIGPADSPLNPNISTRLDNGNWGFWNEQTGKFEDSGIAAPKDAPTVRNAPDGSLIQWDEVTGDWVTIANAPPKDTTARDVAKMQISANAANNAARMAFDAGENAANREFQAGENEKNRLFEGEQSRLGREFTAQENRLGRKLTFDIEEGRREEKTKDRQLAAAEAFARYVNSVDPTALPAFLAAGGGNLGGGSLVNAEKAGANAITDKALLPAARQLGIARTDYQPRDFESVYADQAGGLPDPEAKVVDPIATSSVGPETQLGPQVGGRLRKRDPIEPLETRMPRNPYLRALQKLKDARFADGGMTRARELMVGDAPGKNPKANGAKPEVIMNPTGAPLGIVPTKRLGQIPRFSEGTLWGGGTMDWRTRQWLESQRQQTTEPAKTEISYGDDTKNVEIGDFGTTTEPVQPPPPVVTTTTQPAPQPVVAPDPVAKPTPTIGPTTTAPAPGLNAGLVTTPDVVGTGLDLGITSADVPLMDEVRTMRENTPQFADADFLYRLDFWNQLPTWRKSMLLGLQAKTGIDAENWEAEAIRQKLGGLGRESVRVRY